MPVFEFHCDRCDLSEDVFQGAHEVHEHKCDKCGNPSRRIYSPAITVMEFSAGFDMGLGTYVDTKKQRETEMRERNLVRIR